MAKFAAVRTAYYKHDQGSKSGRSGLLLLDHIRSQRNGKTRSENVHAEYTSQNFGEYYHGGDSQHDSYMALRQRHEEQIGKSIRADFNALFEHVIVLSVEQIEKLETKNSPEAVKKFLLDASKDYAKAIKDKWGFEPIGVDWHMDEGYTDKGTGKFVRNVHAHLTFYNRDFKQKSAPLRTLGTKQYGKDGKVPALNPNFEWMQDQIATSFKHGGFVRGVSRGADNRKNLGKLDYLVKLERDVNTTKQKLIKLTNGMGDMESSLRERLTAILQPMIIALRDSVDEINPQRTRQIKMALGALEEIKPELPPQVAQKLDEVTKVIEPIQRPTRRM